MDKTSISELELVIGNWYNYNGGYIDDFNDEHRFQ